MSTPLRSRLFPAHAGAARPGGSSAWRVALRGGEGRAGLALITLTVALALAGPALAPYSPAATGVGVPLSGPSWAHLPGCDNLGRDILSRVLSGGASVLVPPAIGTAAAIAAGAAVGLTSGYAGGRADLAVTRVLDVLLAVPPLLTVLLIAAALGTGNTVVVIALALVSAPKVARVLRGATQNLRASDFISAAQARGERLSWILRREVLPNLTATVMVEIAIRYTFAIIFVATLNFLGLGQQPPSPNWGLMVSEGRDYLVQAPLAALAPALAIALLVVGVHLTADALAQGLAARDHLAVRA